LAITPAGLAGAGVGGVLEDRSERLRELGDPVTAGSQRLASHGADCMRSESPRGISLHVVNLDEIEAGLKARLGALPPAARAELRHVLRLLDFERADRIGEFWGHPKTRPLENS
jgi:hypothetical protein